MLTLKKELDRDFIVLNLTDIQMGDAEWDDGHVYKKILTNTVTELVNRVKPGLITLSGDLAWAGQVVAYESLADFIDGFEIPWTVAWGNHDNQDGPEFINQMVESYLKRKYFIYEKGEESLGNGNFVIGIEEDGRIVEGIFIMDTHDRAPYTDAEGNTIQAWAKMIPEQIDWYKQQVRTLSEMGCNDTVMIMHIPIYAYRLAYDAAMRNEVPMVGVQHEGICSYPAEDGVFDAITELKSTKYVIAGHEHVNNWMIRYKDVTLIYSLKTGAGGYWEECMNGGTVIQINSKGVSEVRHESVDAKNILK